MLSNFFKFYNLFSYAVKNARNLSMNASNPIILYCRENGIIKLGMNRPEAKNALGKKLIASLSEALESIKCDNSVRVLILHSLVKNTFCVGGDLKEEAVMTESEFMLFVASFRQVIASVLNFPFPTIAAIDGYALAGGLELSLACDIRIASVTAKMGLVETKFSIIPGCGGTQLLPRLIGPAVAKEFIYTGRMVDGAQAQKIGLVNDVVAQNSDGNAAFLKAIELAEEISLQGPIAVKLAKIAINRGLETDVNTGLAFEQACYAQVIGTKDRVEGLKAFKEKRLPKYKAE